LNFSFSKLFSLSILKRCGNCRFLFLYLSFYLFLSRVCMRLEFKMKLMTRNVMKIFWIENLNTKNNRKLKYFKLTTSNLIQKLNLKEFSSFNNHKQKQLLKMKLLIRNINLNFFWDFDNFLYKLAFLNLEPMSGIWFIWKSFQKIFFYSSFYWEMYLKSSPPRATLLNLQLWLT
jgi:hypothetical protein